MPFLSFTLASFFAFSANWLKWVLSIFYRKKYNKEKCFWSAKQEQEESSKGREGKKKECKHKTCRDLRHNFAMWNSKTNKQTRSVCVKMSNIWASSQREEQNKLNLRYLQIDRIYCSGFFSSSFRSLCQNETIFHFQTALKHFTRFTVIKFTRTNSKVDFFICLLIHRWLHGERGFCEVLETAYFVVFTLVRKENQ